jgi:hypothetical protein
MTKFLLNLVALVLTGTAWGQGAQLPLTYKGACSGTQTDIHDMSAIQDTPAIKCDSLIVMQMKGHTSVSFSNGDLANPVLAFSGDLSEVHSGIPQPFDPYMGPITSFFAIDSVLWGDGSPVEHIKAADNMTGTDATAGRVCLFHFIGEGWGQMDEVECELVVDTQNHRPRRATVTFKTERKFTVEGREISVEYAVHGANSFRTKLDQMEIDGTCGLGIYQTADGALRHVEPGSPIDRLFQVVCYKQSGMRTK